MKIRNGFVSNSSSSSYIIEIKGSPRKILNFIKEECLFYDAKEKTIEKAKEIIKQIKEEIDEYQIKSNKKQLKMYEKFLKNIERHEGLKLLKDILEFWQVKLKIKDYSIRFEFRSVMHNCYIESLPDILKEILLFIVFEFKEVTTDTKRFDNENKLKEVRW